MKNKPYRNSVLLLINAIALCLVLGCTQRVSKECIVTEEVSKSGNHWTTTESVQEYYGHGKAIKDRQVVYEKEKCVGKDGKTIQATTIGECMKKGGRIVNVIRTEEEVIQRRR